MAVDGLNLLVSLAVLLGTAVLIWLTWLMVRRRDPLFRLDHIDVRPHRPSGGWLDEREPWPLSLVFVNDGPGTAPATHAYLVNAPRHSGEMQYPPNGSPTIPPGGSIAVDWSFTPDVRSDQWPPRKYDHGDDMHFHMEEVMVRFEWGVRRRRSQVLKDLHRDQWLASPQVQPEPAGWSPEPSIPGEMPPSVSPDPI